MKSKNGYWNDEERIKQAAAQCKGRFDFSRKYPAAYSHAVKRGMLDELFRGNTVTPDGVKKHSYSSWTNAELAKALSGFRTRSEAKLRLGDAIVAQARERGILDDLLPRRKAEKYSRESALLEAANFSSLTEFMRARSGAYGYILDNNLLEDLHRVIAPSDSRSQPKVWTEAKLRQLAVTLKGDPVALRKRYPGAYGQLSKNQNLRRELFPAKRRSIDVNTALAAARSCTTRTELAKRFPSAYRVLAEARMLDDCIPRRNARWDVAATSSLLTGGEVKSRRQLLSQYPAAYKIAKEHKLLDLHLPLRRAMSVAEAQAIGKQCSNRTELATRSLRAYKILHDQGLIDEILPLGKVRWSKAKVRKCAAMCATRTEFQQRYPGGYGAALRYGRDFLDAACAHMQDRTPSDRDTVYLWKSQGEYFNGKPVYKFGVTSARLGTRRILQAARSAKANAEIVKVMPVSINADVVEGQLLSLGQDPMWLDRDGATEYRALSDDELLQALQIMEQFASGPAASSELETIDGSALTSGRRHRDNAVRTWVHVSGEIFRGSRHEMRNRIGCSESALSKVATGQRAHVRGWALDEAPSSADLGYAGARNPRADPRTYRWVNDDGRKDVCTRYEMKLRYGLTAADTSGLLSGKRRSAKGWRILA